MGSVAKSIEVVIDRPVEDVFAYISDPANLPDWISGISDITKSAPQMSVGASYGYKRRFLGRSVDGTSTVTAFEPTHHYAYTVRSGDQAVNIDYQLTAVGSGTVLALGVQGEVSGIFGIAPGLAIGQYEKDLAVLKVNLQGPAYGHDVRPEGGTGQAVAP